MRLLLDDHYSRLIAERLRQRGHDAVSAAERADLSGMADEDLMVWAAGERRAIVTENWADFDRRLRAWAEEGRSHYGVLFTSRQRLPRSRKTVGLHVRALEGFLAAHPAEDALANGYAWLP